jgi:DNA-binding PadR family transcriptional regulator
MLKGKRKLHIDILRHLALEGSVESKLKLHEELTKKPMDRKVNLGALIRAVNKLEEKGFIKIESALVGQREKHRCSITARGLLFLYEKKWVDVETLCKAFLQNFEAIKEFLLEAFSEQFTISEKIEEAYMLMKILEIITPYAAKQGLREVKDAMEDIREVAVRTLIQWLEKPTASFSR